MEISFHGKRALVTGAGKGIGRAVALKLAECGAEVIAVTRTQSDLDTLKKECPKIETLCVDIGNWELTESALKNVGTIDLLVNNAGVLEAKLFGNFTIEDCDKIFNTNVKAIINITQLIAQGMKTRGKGGAIVNVSSISGLVGMPYFGLYSSSKCAMDGLTRGMAAEFGQYDIRVNSVSPTITRTPMAKNGGLLDRDNVHAQKIIKRTPLGRIAELEDVVSPILFLLSDKAALITGVTLPIDGGLTNTFI